MDESQRSSKIVGPVDVYMLGGRVCGSGKRRREGTTEGSAVLYSQTEFVMNVQFHEASAW